MKNNVLKTKKNQYLTLYILIMLFCVPLVWAEKSLANPAITIDKTKIDDQFLLFEEGKSLKGYVPKVKGSKSGITIGYGVDLGQMHTRELDDLKISIALKNKLRPYVGLKQEKAVWFLKNHPLTITHEQMLQLSLAAKNKILKPLVVNYNRHSQKSFTDIPPQAQTAIFSFAYQMGPGFMKKPNSYQLWRSFISQDWAQASQLLREYRLYTNRRGREAQLLDQITTYRA